MTIKALTSFVGEVSMGTGEVREVSDEVGKDVVAAGYAEEVKANKQEPAKKPAKK